MRTFKAAAQAGVAMIAVTETIAGHLVQNRRNLGRGLIGFNVGRSNKTGSSELLLRQYRRQLGGYGRRRGRSMKCWNIRLLAGELRMSHAGGKEDCEHTQKMLHITDILLQNSRS